MTLHANVNAILIKITIFPPPPKIEKGGIVYFQQNFLKYLLQRKTAEFSYLLPHSNLF